jgi:hypothetical protein
VINAIVYSPSDKSLRMRRKSPRKGIYCKLLERRRDSLAEFSRPTHESRGLRSAKLTSQAARQLIGIGAGATHSFPNEFLEAGFHFWEAARPRGMKEVSALVLAHPLRAATQDFATDGASIRDLAQWVCDESAGQDVLRALLQVLATHQRRTDTKSDSSSESRRRARVAVILIEKDGQTEYPAWILEVLRCEASGRGAQSLDIVFDTLDDWLLNDEFEKCDSFLKDAPIDLLSVAQLLTVLAATRAAAEQLQNRRGFLERAKRELVSRGRDAESLITER